MHNTAAVVPPVSVRNENIPLDDLVAKPLKRSATLAGKFRDLPPPCPAQQYLVDGIITRILETVHLDLLDTKRTVIRP